MGINKDIIQYCLGPQSKWRENNVMAWYGFKDHFQLFLTSIMGVSFIGGGNRSTRWKIPTCGKSQTNIIT